jgi:hypothetical protein
VLCERDAAAGDAPGQKVAVGNEQDAKAPAPTGAASASAPGPTRLRRLAGAAVGMLLLSLAAP